MSQLSTNPNTTYMIETDPNFTDRRNFLRPITYLSRLKLDPMNVQKRLGDGYYEQQLVMQEIMSQTGKSRLQSGLSAEEQYRQLMDAGISVTKSQSIALGRGLTEAEQKNLKEDVVLLVSKAVVLPNGKTETVLVPTLYLAPTTKRVEGAANLQAQSINLSVDTMHTSGSIVADKDVTIQATPFTMIMVLLKVTLLRLQRMTKFVIHKGLLWATIQSLCMQRKTSLMKAVPLHKLMQLVLQRLVRDVI